MTAYPAWTPASRPGIIPLHPLTFGTILGRSFVALRQNPRVLLGFALVVQTLAYIVVIVVVAAIGWAAFSRLDTLQPGTDEFDTVLAGSIAITAIAGVVLGLAAGALSVIVQGIVVSEVAHAAVAERLTLGGLWQAVKPVAWRLLGYAFLLVVAILVSVGLLALGIFGVGVVAPAGAIGLTVVLVLAAIPLLWWLSTKLLMTPAVIILEHATIRQAIGRSWRLIRGRFWVVFGVVLVISVTFNVVAQVVGIPFTLLSSGLTTIIAPTGDPEPSAIIGVVITLVLTQVVTFLIQSVAIVVQSTATALLYIDCRMRHEGLDLDLLTYVERRDAGIPELADPYREHIGREIAPRVPVAYAPPGYAQPGYAPPGYAQPGYPTVPPYAVHAGQPTLPPPPGYRQAPPMPPQPVQPVTPVQTAAPAQPVPPVTGEDTPPPPTRWAAPGASSDRDDRESPWG